MAGDTPVARRNLWPESLISAVAVTVVAGLLLATQPAAPARRLAADALLRAAARWRQAPATDLPDVSIVAIDPQSLRAHPEWPWPRRLYARAIERLDAAGVRAIAFDIDFSTPRDPDDDAAFAAAIDRSGRVVLATFRQVQILPDGGSVEVASVPIPAFAAGAAALGSVLMPVDPDGVVRHAPRSSEIGARQTVSLAEAALAVSLGAETAASAEGTLPLDYRRSRPAIPVVPIAELIAGRFDPRDVAGRVVLIGATAAEFQDLWASPLGPARPGVWLQAITYRTLAAARAGQAILRYAPPSAALAASLALCVVASALASLGHARRISALALLALGAGTLDLACVVTRGWLIDPVVPLGALALQYTLGLERVREHLGRVVAHRERSLMTLSQVGEAATAPAGADPLGVALALLGDVVEASGVALFRASSNGTLDGRRLDWGRHSGTLIGDTAAATAALEARMTRTYEENVPGGEGSGGLAVYTPLFAGEVPVGVLVVERDRSDPLDATALRTIATVGTQIALSAENLRLIEDLRCTFDSSVEAIATAIEARDGYTESHCRRLAVFSVSIAEHLGLDAEEVESIRLGALLHDVGKIGIRDEVLLKRSRFTPEERAEMQSHAAIGERVVLPIHGLSATTAACVRHHHERWDGSGYPDGLAGKETPLAARIVALVDVWDALSTARPYKPGYTQAQVRDRLLKGRGSQFEPALVDLFLRVLDEEGDELLAFIGTAGERVS
jgi:HD-GYP domain-containing protein (c-di-GMP phosphodiesterase class II)/CHASE2 domain-containing sensor protein